MRPSFSIRFPSSCPLDNVMLKDVLLVLFPSDCNLDWYLDFWDGNLYEQYQHSLALKYVERFQEGFASILITWHDLLKMSNEPFQIAEATIIGVNRSASPCNNYHALQCGCDSLQLICNLDADIIIEVLDYGEWTVFTWSCEHILSLRRLLRDKGLSI